MTPTAIFSWAALPLFFALYLSLWWEDGPWGTNALLGAELCKARARRAREGPPARSARDRAASRAQALGAEAIGLFVAYHDDKQTRDNCAPPAPPDWDPTAPAMPARAWPIPARARRVCPADWSSRLTNEIIYLQTRVRERAHNLLLNTLPAPIVQQIAQGTVRKVSRFDAATVLQCDLVGFTKLSAEFSPQQVVDFVSELFKVFDQLADKYGADKIKTIGDAYVVCAGALSPCASPEAVMVELGIEMETICLSSRTTTKKFMI